MKKLFFLAFLMSFAFVSLNAQPLGSGNGDNELPGCDAPIDGGISILLVAGAAYGAKKFFNQKS